MQNKARTIVIFDTEYTAWEGSWQRDWSESWEHRELVQISAIKIDPVTLEEVAPRLDIIVRPRINKTLSDYFTNLTSITNNMVDKRGVDFETAARDFHDYCHGADIYSFGDDCAVMNENIGLYKLEKDITRFHGKDIRHWCRHVGVNLQKKIDGVAVTSGTLARAVGAAFRGKAHYAMNDVLSIYAAIRHLVRQKNKPNPFLMRYSRS